MMVTSEKTSQTLILLYKCYFFPPLNWQLHHLLHILV